MPAAPRNSSVTTLSSEALETPSAAAGCVQRQRNTHLPRQDFYRGTEILPKGSKIELNFSAKAQIHQALHKALARAKVLPPAFDSPPVRPRRPPPYLRFSRREPCRATQGQQHIFSPNLLPHRGAGPGPLLAINALSGPSCCCCLRPPRADAAPASAPPASPAPPGGNSRPGGELLLGVKKGLSPTATPRWGEQLCACEF